MQILKYLSKNLKKAERGKKKKGKKNPVKSDRTLRTGLQTPSGRQAVSAVHNEKAVPYIQIPENIIARYLQSVQFEHSVLYKVFNLNTLYIRSIYFHSYMSLIL
ncbi:MAG: hypothetical protein DRI57_23070 [Deltaproteobacteria bacterium]|nr:MAG: hypothetical protein DRI57_23070 [Deltaproteobacteria bacterium]